MPTYDDSFAEAPKWRLRDPFARKSLADCIAQSEARAGGLQRRFGPLTLTLFGVGTMIGLGIFVVTGEVAARSAGPAVMLSFLIASAIVACAALCYAELASMVPVVGGSAYTYAYVTLGELAAWLIAWDLLLEYLCGAAALSIGWSGYFTKLAADCGLVLPAAFTQGPFLMEGNQLILTGAVANVPAIGLILAASALVTLGTASVARFGSLLVALKLGAILLFILFGLAHIHPANWHPFIPPVEVVGGSTRYGLTGVIAGVGLIFYSYLGFDTISTAAQETRDPQRTMPRAILAALAICTALYALVALTLTGLVPFRSLDVPAPLYEAIDRQGGTIAWLKPVISFGGTVGLCSGVLAVLFSQSRIFYAMARDGLLPARFAELAPRTGTPWLGVLLSGVIAAALAGIMPISLLGELVSAGTLLGFAVVCGSVIWLRIREPDAERSFRVPCWPVTTAVALTGCLYFLMTMSRTSFLRISIWMLLGAIVYFTYRKISHSGPSFKNASHTFNKIDSMRNR